MTATLISLISIFMGIIGSNVAGVFYKKYSFGLIGNTIAGVFGSVFIIKLFGRLGFDSGYIVDQGHVNYILFSLNCIISFISGVLAIIVIFKVKEKLSPSIKKV